MIGMVSRWLVGGGLRALTGELMRARNEMASAATAQARAAAEVRVKEIEADLAHRRAIAEVRTATSGQWEMRVLVLVAGLPPALHFGAVCLDSALPDLFPGWTVHALPTPMNEWQGAIILSLFGLSAVKIAAATLRRR
jgi:hypothetical protein